MIRNGVKRLGEKLQKGSEIILRQCMGVEPNERIVIVTDDKKYNIGKALYDQACAMGNDAVITMMKPRGVSGEEPPELISTLLKESDVAICVTSQSLTHTNARLNAVKSGTRIATMPGITEEMFSKGPILADYKSVEEKTIQLTEKLTTASTCRIITGEKHELIINIKNRKGVASTGVYRKKGESGNLPSGEAYSAPIEAEGNGTFYVDGSIVGVGLLKKPILITIENGKIIKIEGEEKEKVEKAIPNNQLSRTIGELGIGTNPMARVTGVILEDEKIYGSAHIAFGTNITFGGILKANSHIDCVTLKPTIYFDDELIVENGQIII